MSVCVLVQNATNDYEKNFIFPIAVEKVYQDCWLQFAENNNLYWLKCFMYGIEVKKSDFPAIINELLQFQTFITNTSEPIYFEKKEYILARITLFLEKLNQAEKTLSDDVILFIG